MLLLSSTKQLLTIKLLRMNYFKSDGQHLEYARKILNGKMKAKDFTFVSDARETKNLLADELCHGLNPAVVAELANAFAALLEETPDNLPKLSKIIAFWQDKALAPYVWPGLLKLCSCLDTLALKAATPEIAHKYQQAQSQVFKALSNTQAPFGEAKNFVALCKWPYIAVNKLDLLTENMDCSNALKTLPPSLENKIVLSVALELIVRGNIHSLPELVGWLNKLGRITRNLPEKMELALVQGIIRRCREKKEIDNRLFDDLVICLRMITPETAVNILLKLANENLVLTETSSIICGARGPEQITSSAPDITPILRELGNYAALNSPELTFRIAAGLMNVKPLQEFQELAAKLVQTPQPRIEKWIVLLNFAQMAFQLFGLSKTALQKCLQAVAQNSRAYVGAVEIAEFKHQIARIKNPLSIKDLCQDADYVLFYADSPNAQDWKRFLPCLVKDDAGLPQNVRRTVLQELIRRHKSETPDFMPRELLEQLLNEGFALPDAWEKRRRNG